MEYDIHTVLDFLTLAATAWVIYELILPLKDTYQGDQDTIQWYYVVSHSRCFLVILYIYWIVFFCDVVNVKF